MIWFNPPYSKSVKTNLGAKFLRLIRKHFPPGHALNRIFNRNTLKLSYSCTTNMSSIIQSHNRRAAKKTKEPQNHGKISKPLKTCNCRIRNECPLDGKCLTEAIVYKATVCSMSTVKQYIGLTGGTFKSRYYNHTKSFRQQKYVNDTELSKYVWQLKERGYNYSIKWEILKHSNTLKRSSGICNLCLEEKIHILKCAKNSLNKRTELISTCRHSRPSNRAKKK